VGGDGWECIFVVTLQWLTDIKRSKMVTARSVKGGRNSLAMVPLGVPMIIFLFFKNDLVLYVALPP
jgi:hypothetical protein